MSENDENVWNGVWVVYAYDTTEYAIRIFPGGPLGKDKANTWCVTEATYAHVAFWPYKLTLREAIEKAEEKRAEEVGLVDPDEDELSEEEHIRQIVRDEFQKVAKSYGIAEKNSNDHIDKLYRFALDVMKDYKEGSK